MNQATAFLNLENNKLKIIKQNKLSIFYSSLWSLMIPLNIGGIKMTKLMPQCSPQPLVRAFP